MRFITLTVPPVVPASDLGHVATLKHGSTFLVSDAFGDVQPDSRGLGLYHEDTRLISRLQLRLDGARPLLLQAAAESNHRGTIHLTRSDLAAAPEGDHPRQPIVVERDRSMAGGFRERLRVTGYGSHPEPIEIRLEIASDAADIFEVRGYGRPERGTSLPVAVAGDRITFRYVGRDGLEHRTYLAFSPAAESIEPSDDVAGLRLTWRPTLTVGGSAEIAWRAWSDLVPAPASAALFPVPPAIHPDDGAADYRAWTSGTTAVDTDHEVFNRVIARSLADLRLLLNDGPAPGEHWLSAGIPWFATLFGRDAIIASLQLIAFRPQLAVKTLLVLAARQATAVDPWREAEPGRILHELRSGEMVRSGELPFGPYYGSVDATPLWLILLSEVHRWTGDLGLIDRLWPNALAALEWIDRWGDRDGDGFVEYGPVGRGGLVNQGWKDSADSVRRRDGSVAAPPIRLAEVQGYVYDARHRMAELARLRGDAELAATLEARAEAGRRAFEERFWLADRGSYAMALDGDGRPADALASNVGHCLWSGIVSPERARAVADCLLGPELFSGWGVRTYASGQPGFNPIGYHTGTVWPHDTALAAAGLHRYGFHDEANRLATSLFEATQHFPSFRLPELFCGFDRDATGVPIAYPVACSPQAWAAGATYHLLATMLGLDAHADRRELELRSPHLPSWLSRVTLTNVRVGAAAVDLLFHQRRGTTSVEVVREVGDVSVTIRL